MYKKFMTHAARILRTLSDTNIKLRPFLKGVKHYENGSAVVTNTHVLYYVKDIHEKGDTLITPKGIKMGKENDRYPEVERLFPSHDPVDKIEIDSRLMLKAVELMELAQKESKNDLSMIYRDNELKIENKYLKNESSLVSAMYELPEDYMVNNKFLSNPGYWVLALKMFRAFKYDTVIFNFYHPYKPFTLVSPDDRLTALIMPIRNYR